MRIPHQYAAKVECMRAKMNNGCIHGGFRFALWCMVSSGDECALIWTRDTDAGDKILRYLEHTMYMDHTIYYVKHYPRDL